jgi:hypothetical protein
MAPVIRIGLPSGAAIRNVVRFCVPAGWPIACLPLGAAYRTLLRLGKR